ncbi:MAG: hypothetical protein ACLF0P_16070 [Thermoanaerobaculia bacterium]
MRDPEPKPEPRAGRAGTPGVGEPAGSLRLDTGWPRGALGAVLAVPMIASVKIVCDEVEPLAPVGELLGG